MTEDELELEILKRYVAQYKTAAIGDPEGRNKCLRELDLEQVLAELTGQTGNELTYTTRHWLGRLAPKRLGSGMGPLKPCANALRKTGEHRYHVRAWQGHPTNGPPDAWRRIRELQDALERRAWRPLQTFERVVEISKETQSMSTKTTKLRLFISHSSDDREVAERLIELVRAALYLRHEEIRCTSVPGYKLQAGTDTDEQLLLEVHETETLVGLLSARSLRSLYVLFELGARWGTQKHWIPLLSPGTPATALGGPIGGKNALTADSRDDLFQLVSDLADQLGITQAKPEAYSKYVDKILELRPEPEKKTVTETDRVSRVIANLPTKLTPSAPGSTTVPDVVAGKRATSPVAITWAPNPNGLDLEIVSSQDDAVRGFTLLVRDLRRRSQSGQFVEVPEFHGDKKFEQLDLDVEKTLYCEAPVRRTFLAVTPGGGLDFRAKRLQYNNQEPRNIPRAGIWQVTLSQLSSVGNFSTTLYFEWTPGNPPVPWTPPPRPLVDAAPEPVQPVTSINRG